MSLEKVELFSTAPEEEGQPRRQRLPFAVAREDSSSSSLFQATNFFGSNGPSGTHRELFGFSGQSHHHQQPSDLFSLEESKCLSISLKDQAPCDSHGFPGGKIPNGPIKWMSSKMRVMRKMMAEERISATSKPKRRMHRPPQFQQPLLGREIGAEIRVCSGCSTTKTPLWRSGPQGPKSLCNACGIRRMKARRVVVASTASRDNAVLRNGASERAELVIPFKKRHKFSGPLQESSPSSPAFHPAFPQDEKEAAVLLMALSCG